MTTKKPLPDDWMVYLKDEFTRSYMNDLRDTLKQEIKTATIFPPMDQIFKAFHLTNFEKVRVVILGQDPYHNPGQAQGLAFSVPDGVPTPPSLKNIFKEIKTSYGTDYSFKSGNLTNWAVQGVFLLNTVLTVRKNRPASHKNLGWETFTDKVISILSQKKNNLVFLLWGSLARSKKPLINPKSHLILEASHPSPFSADRGFFGCDHFRKANEYLKKNNLTEINWLSL